VVWISVLIYERESSSVPEHSTDLSTQPPRSRQCLMMPQQTHTDSTISSRSLLVVPRYWSGSRPERTHSPTITPSTSDPPHRTSTSFSSSLARHRISRLPSLWFYASFLVPFHLPSITRSSSPPPLPPSFVAIMSLYDEQLGVFDDVTRALAVAASRPSTNASECPSTRCTYYIPQVIARKAHFRSVIDSRASLPSVLLPLIGTHMYVRTIRDHGSSLASSIPRNLTTSRCVRARS